MSEDLMLKEAIQAIHQGQRLRARDLITRLLRADQANPEYWLWMSSLVDSFKEQVFCLQSAQKLDPENPAIKQGLVLLGAMPADANIKPVPPVFLHWEIPLQEVPRTRLLGKPVSRMLAYTGLVVFLISAVLLGALGVNRKLLSSQAFIPTRTLGPSPTYTATPTVSNFTPVLPTQTPRSTGVPPLWTRLEATYTPTPVYISTRHPINEAYRVGQQALSRNELDFALENLQQAVNIEPDSPDILYTLGEIYRSQGELDKSLAAYESALEIDNEFAPAYLGRGRLLRLLDPSAEIQPDLEKAVELDPGFGEAQLELIDFLLEKEDLETASEYLDAAAELMPDSALVHLYLARVHLLLKENEPALEEAILSNQLDLTLLDTYRVLGEAALLNGNYDEAFDALDTYLQYQQGDATAWLIYGEALYATTQYSDTIKALDTAIQLDPSMPEAYHTKGLAYIEMGQGQKGVNEIYQAIKLQPGTFNYQLDFARALFTAGRLDEAVSTMFSVERLAAGADELAQVYYWRATMLEAKGESSLAQKDWRRLLDLEEVDLPAEWLKTAEAHVQATVTPTSTRTPSPTDK